MSTSGYEPYHKSRVTPEVGVSVADFLIYDPLFPRSIRYCLRQCQEAAHAISRRPLGECGNEAESAIRDLIVWLERRTIDDMVRAGLHEALTHVVNEVLRIGEIDPQNLFRRGHANSEFFAYAGCRAGGNCQERNGLAIAGAVNRQHRGRIGKVVQASRPAVVQLATWWKYLTGSQVPLRNDEMTGEPGA